MPCIKTQNAPFTKLSSLTHANASTYPLGTAPEYLYVDIPSTFAMLGTRKSEIITHVFSSFCRYLIVEDHLRCQLDNKFPRLKVVLTMDLDNNRYPHLLPCRIDVFESVNVRTVSILLQIPLLWQVYDKGEVWCEPVSSVDRITVKDEAWVLGHVPAEKDDDWLSKTYCRLLSTQFDLEHQHPSENLRQTLVNILWLTLSVVDRPRNKECYLDGAAKEDVPGLDFVATNGGIPVADLLIETVR